MNISATRNPSLPGDASPNRIAKGYFELPLFNHELKQLIGRVNLVCAVMPELEFPPFDEAAITKCLARAFRRNDIGERSPGDSFARGVSRSIWQREQLAWLDELTPLGCAVARRSQS